MNCLPLGSEAELLPLETLVTDLDLNGLRLVFTNQIIQVEVHEEHTCNARRSEPVVGQDRS